MIDLIIPYYNNPEGLARTLESINKEVFHITVVDDNSLIYMPYNVDVDQVLRYNANRGPGFARQFGLERTHEPYVMFLDTGDVFISKEVQYRIEYELVNTKAVLASYLYYHYDELSKHTDNRLHGKIYQRAFLEEYGISFPLESSYLNEDVGFNRACKLIIENNKLLQTRTDLPVIRQTKDENSLTQKDNQVVLYRDQTRALSLVSIHTIDTLIKNNINPQEEINHIAMSLYYWFIRTAAERIEFLPQAWDGAKIFYQKYKKEIQPNQLVNGNAYLKNCLTYRRKLHFPINVLKFAHEILVEENLPSYYLT